jgi:uncharacterized repeat protein (TIGR03803 family)
VQEIIMRNPAQHSTSIFGSGLWGSALVLALVWVLTMAAMQPAQAQIFTVLHDFTGGADGYQPVAGLTKDAAGNFYGTTYRGGEGGFTSGVVFKFKSRHSGWTLSTLADFGNDDNGYNPESRVAVGPDNAIYSSTLFGGVGCGGNGCGTIFKLVPAASVPRTARNLDAKTVLHRFSGPDGAKPLGDLVFDAAGNLYGTTASGGAYNGGTVFELSPTADGWEYKVLYSFAGGADGYQPLGGVVVDQAGNLYGTTQQGGAPNNYGTVFELSPSGNGWTYQLLHVFKDTTDGGWPVGGLIFDPYGNLFGTASVGGPTGGGTVFELSRFQGTWIFSMLYNLPAGNGPGPQATLVMDAYGNLYGTTTDNGADYVGTVFELSPSVAGWVLTTLHTFFYGDGGRPISNLVLDADGNLYGTTSEGGMYGGGNIFEITP